MTQKTADKTAVNGNAVHSKSTQPSSPKKKPARIKGTLLALGGGDDEGLLLLIRSELCRLESYIEIITTATQEPDRSGPAYMAAFKKLGCGNARYLQIDEQHPADDPKTLARLEKADVVFFTGGDQMRLSAYLAGTDFLELIIKKLKTDSNFVVAGTSAGACAMSNRMIYEGYGADAYYKGEIKITGGLGFVRNLFIDTHFTERGRFGRLAQAVARQPSCVGVGLGEETGIMIRDGHKISVFGRGIVTIIDGSMIKYTNLEEAGSGDPIAVENLVVHFMVEGHEFEVEHHSYRARIKKVKNNGDSIAMPDPDEEERNRQRNQEDKHASK